MGHSSRPSRSTQFPHLGRWTLVLGVFALGSLGTHTARAAPQNSAEQVAQATSVDAGETPETGERLSARHRQFLEEVELLIDDEERDVFLGLQRDYQREAFIRTFWRVRDPYPETARNELAERWQTRVDRARDRFEELTGVGARTFLLLGEPEAERRVSCPETLRPFDVWLYSRVPGVRGSFSVILIRQGGGKDPFRRWTPSEGLSPLMQIARVDGALTDENLATQIRRNCSGADEILGSLTSSIAWGEVERRGGLLPDPGDEWLRAFVGRSTDVPEGAAELPGSIELAFPGRYGSRTVVQGFIQIPRSAATIGEVGERRAMNFLVDGEVLREGELFDQFRVRFDFPAAADSGADAETELPLVVQRHLRPGDYRLILKVADVNGDSYLRRELDLEVPNLPSPGALAVAADGSLVTLDEATTEALALEEANAALGHGDHSVRLMAPHDELRVGNLRVEARTTGDDVARVAFWLDGRRVLSKTRPPYSVELNLGSAPRLHRVEAVAETKDGSELARDEVMINAGPHRFAVRLIEPRRGGRYRDSLRAHAVVEVPQGESLDRVEFFLDERRLSTLFSPPFVQPILLPGDEALRYVRTVAYLKDGNSTEDVVFVNAPVNQDAIDVHFVELYTSVVDRRGRPIEGLSREAFTVLEDGEPQEIARFEKVRDLPIYAGVLLDTSGSMDARIGEAVDSALGFFDQVLTPRDRAAVITFNEQPSLVARFTNDAEILAGGLAGLRPDGETALYDSIVYALHYFSGIRNKRALIVISDGQDVSSRYSFEDTLDYARRTGVAIYTVGIDLGSSRDHETRSKLSRLAESTGGSSFFISRAGELRSVYARVEQELRNQYLIAYQSPIAKAGDNRFREVTIEIDEPGQPGLEAKTAPGYYP